MSLPSFCLRRFPLSTLRTAPFRQLESRFPARIHHQARSASKFHFSTSPSLTSLAPSKPRPGSHNPSYLALIASLSLAGISVYITVFDRSVENLESWRMLAPADEYLNPDMPQEIAPGRLGTLTLDEQIKLQEAWRRLAHICNIPLDEPADEEDGEEGHEDSASTADGKQPAKKSKRPKLFRKKSNTVKTDNVPEEEDKWGQTKEFQTALKENTPQDIRSTVWSMVKMDHPDSLILRFLRARKWDVDKALIMMISTMNWRKRDMHIEDTIVHEGELVALKEEMNKDDEGFMEQYRIGKSFVHGVDNKGRPICIIRARYHIPGAQTMKSLEDYTVHTIETARMTLRDPVDTATLIFDMTDFSIKNMDNKPIQFMIKCFEANYPESLGLVAVHKAPWVFQGIWRLIRGWLDPVVAAKINFTNTTEDLEQFIPRSNILKEFGGDDNWTYEYKEPTAEENTKLRDTATRDKLLAEREKLIEEYEAKTRQWLKYAPVEPEFKQLMEERNELAERLRVGYWVLDPYLRARSLYDRTGIIKEGGKINFYPYRNEKA